MYVLKRKPGESFVIDGRVTVTVLGMTPSLVRIGVEAPDDVSVCRVETETESPSPSRRAKPKEK